MKKGLALIDSMKRLSMRRINCSNLSSGVNAIVLEKDGSNEAIMAAVLSRSLNEITTITKYMDECKAMGIKVLGPDINESVVKFGVDKNKNIRFGLAAVKGVGEVPANHIIDERKKNGPFKDIYDFVERINLFTCNKKSIEALAYAGAFDNLGIKREEFFTPCGSDELFSGMLMRYGAKFKEDKESASLSLFGGNDIVILRPKIPKCEPWSDLERLNKEKEMIGMYLSAHPLDEYRIILDYVCNTSAIELADKDALKGRKITLGGIVTGVRESVTKKGMPYAIMKHIYSLICHKLQVIVRFYNRQQDFLRCIPFANECFRLNFVR